MVAESSRRRVKSASSMNPASVCRSRAAAARACRSSGALAACLTIELGGLARRLDVAPNALYSHVDSKTALLDDLLDDLLAAVSVPDPAAPDPSAAVARMMEASYAVLTAHPDLVPMFLSRQGARGPNAVRLGEVLDQLLVHAGVAEADVAPANRAGAAGGVLQDAGGVGLGFRLHHVSDPEPLERVGRLDHGEHGEDRPGAGHPPGCETCRPLAFRRPVDHDEKFRAMAGLIGPPSRMGHAGSGPPSGPDASFKPVL